MSDSLQCCVPQPAKLLRPWDFPGKNTDVRCHAFLQHLPNPGIKPMSLMSPALAGRFFTTSASWEPLSGSYWRSFSIQYTAYRTHKLRQENKQGKKQGISRVQAQASLRGTKHRVEDRGSREAWLWRRKDTPITYLIHVSVLKEDL